MRPAVAGLMSAPGAARVSPPPSMDRPTAIVAAMAEELAPLLRRTRVTRRTDLGCLRVECGELGGRAVVLAQTGVGRVRAARGAAALLERFDVDALIVVGVAGGLCPALVPGALVVAREVTDGTTRALRTGGRWADRALRRDGVVAGTVVSSERILCTPEQKARAWNAAGRGPSAVVDMESAAFARVAAEKDVDLVVIRAISDSADETLPLDLNLCCDEYGQLNRLSVLRRAATRPATWGRLWQLRRRVSLCSDTLARFVESLLREGRS